MVQIGVLALQGAFNKHCQMLEKLHVPHFELRYKEEIQECSHLIIPGGESTTMWGLIVEKGLEKPLKSFSGPIFGTCAGLILMSKLGLIGLTCSRNAYGRQSASFQKEIPTNLGTLSAVFIRAPRIKEISSQIEVLARLNDEPVLVKEGNRIASTFHPELTDDPKVHAFFAALN